jgi:prefoldin subunit 5
VKELNKTIHDLKMERETINKSQRDTTLEIKKPRKKIRSYRCKNHQQNTRDKRESQVQKIP